MSLAGVTLGLVPHVGVVAHIVLDDFGKAGRVYREAAETDALVRLKHQIPDAQKAARADYVLENTADQAALRAQTVELWRRLKAESNKIPENEF